jgi:hypothetical protein
MYAVRCGNESYDSDRERERQRDRETERDFEEEQLNQESLDVVVC